jgi:hypothetical protein
LGEGGESVGGVLGLGADREVGDVVGGGVGGEEGDDLEGGVVAGLFDDEAGFVGAAGLPVELGGPAGPRDGREEDVGQRDGGAGAALGVVALVADGVVGGRGLGELAADGR